jgi:hypothetical protein
VSTIAVSNAPDVHGSGAAVVLPVVDWSAAERARLLNMARHELLTSGKVVDLEAFRHGTGRSVGAAHQWLSRHRRGGSLVTISHAGATYVPTYQLDEAFGLKPNAVVVNIKLHRAGFDAWATWTWVSTPNPWLDGARPEDLLDDDLDAVEEAIHGMLQR